MTHHERQVHHGQALSQVEVLAVVSVEILHGVDACPKQGQQLLLHERAVLLCTVMHT